MPNELSDLELDEVSLVGKAANGKKFLLFKSANGSVPMTKTKPARADKAGARALVNKAELLDIVQKAVEPIRKENEELRSIIRKKEYEQIAKSDFSGLGTPEEGAEILKSLEALPSEARKTILKTLKQANAMKAEAGKMLYHQAGSSRPAPGSASEEFGALVTKKMGEIKKSGTAPQDQMIQKALAIDAVSKEHPELAAKVMGETRANSVKRMMGVV